MYQIAYRDERAWSFPISESAYRFICGNATPAEPAADLADEVWDLWRERLVEVHPKHQLDEQP